jgi:glycosyltransferase involved in cell wall biosynthesis
VSKAIVLGDNLRYIFEELVPNNDIIVVPNGIDVNYITEEEFEKAQGMKMTKLPNDSMTNKITLSTKHYALSSRKRILFLSNLMKSKGFFDVVKAMSEVLEHTSNSELIMAGEFREWRMRHEVMLYMDKSKLDSHVKFIGSVVGDQKRNLFLLTDIFVLPTYYRYEGQPWVIVEAMAAGLPIITTDHGCIKEMVVHGENGFLIQKQNPQQISEKIIALLKDDDLRNRMGRKSRERFLKYYTRDIFISGLNNVFEHVYLRKFSS